MSSNHYQSGLSDISPLAEWEHGEPGEVGVDGRPHGQVGDERVQEDVLAVEQLVHLGTDLPWLDVSVVLQNTDHCQVITNTSKC